MSTPVLNEATKQRLALEAEQLVRMGMDRKKARRVVWEDYQEELAALAFPEPASRPLDTPVPEPPRQSETMPTAQFFTPARLRKNRAELAKVKRLIGLRS